MPGEHPYAGSTKVAAFEEEEVTTSPVCSQVGWCSVALGDLPMMRSENGSTQPDRTASERRASFLRPHRVDADDSGEAAFRDCVNATAPF